MAKKRPPSSPPVSPGTWSLDAPRIVTYGGEVISSLFEFQVSSDAQTIQDFVENVHMPEVPARPSDPGENNDRALQLTREIFQQHDYREQPYLRVIGRVLDELLNHRQKETCSGGDVFYVLLKELRDELPATHRQVLTASQPEFNKTRNPGRRVIDNRLKNLKGESREDGKGSGPAWVMTTVTTQGGAEQGFRLTEEGQWLFDGWPELPELVSGRSRVT